jgi:DNA invertase Pin-like site-specific DNA recombinase/transposase
VAGRAVIYARISRDRVGAGLGVERQEQDCRDLAQRLELAVVGVHVDNDLSAYSGKPRPAYRAMLDTVAAGQADTILCWHLDRLTRSVRDLEDIVDLCDAHGVIVRTVSAGDVDLSTASGKMVARILGAAARHEVEHAQERMRRAKAQVRASGGYTGGRRPFGYERGGLVIRETEALVVRDVARRLLLGESLNAVTAALNTGSTPTSTGGRWSAKAVRDVMLRPRNAGIVSHDGLEVGPAVWPALLVDETWRAVRALLRDPARGAGRPGPPPRHLGSGLYRCGVCGSPVLVSQAGNGRRTYKAYRCRATRAHVGRRVDHVDEWVTTAIRERLGRGDIPWADVDPGEAERLQVAAGTQARLLAEADEAYADQVITAEQWRRTSARIRERLDDLGAALDVHARPSPIGGLSPWQAAEQWPDLPLAMRKAVVDAFAVVTIAPAPKGRRPGGGYFDRDSVQIAWRERA